MKHSTAPTDESPPPGPETGPDRRPGLLALALSSFLLVPSLPLLIESLPFSLVLLHALVTWAAARYWFARQRLGPSPLGRRSGLLPVVIWLGLALGFAVIYPVADAKSASARGSDRDDALRLATGRLLEGRHPYRERTYLDNAITPLPGALVLALPLALLGATPAVSLVWLGILGWVCTRWYGGEAAAFVMLALTFGAPIGLHEIVTGGDLLANAIYLLLATLALAQLSSGSPGAFAAAVGFAGLALASRAPFLLVLLPLTSWLRHRLGTTRAALGIVLPVLATATAVTLPFYLASPSAFSPLEVADKLAPAAAVLPHLDWGIVGLSLVGALLLAHRVTSETGMLAVAAIVVALPAVLASLGSVPADRGWALALLVYALPGAAFAVFAALTAARYSTGISPKI